MAEPPPSGGLPVGGVASEAIIGLQGAVLTKDEEQRFAEADRALVMINFR